MFLHHPIIKKIRFRFNLINRSALILDVRGKKSDLEKMSTTTYHGGDPWCGEYNAERQRLFISMAELGVEVYSVFSLFGHSENHQKISKAVLQFLHDTGLYNRI